MRVNSFGEFSRGRQRCAVQLLEPSLLSHASKQRVECLVVLKCDVYGIERCDRRGKRWHCILGILLDTRSGSHSRHLDDADR
jgi:hypothetical protein